MDSFEKIAISEVKIATYPFRRKNLKDLAQRYKLSYQMHGDADDNKLDKIFGTINGQSVEIQDFCTFVSGLNLIFNTKYAVGNTTLALNGKSKDVRGYFRLFPKIDEIEKWIISISNNATPYEVKDSETLYYGVKNSEISNKQLLALAIAIVVITLIGAFLINL
jgi:hypothetical protein